jgi:hypothetical protein
VSLTFRTTALLLILLQPLEAANISAIWANTGEDKVTQDELRAKNTPDSIFNTAWNGERIYVFGSRNEVVAFNVILEAASNSANSVSVSFNKLAGKEGEITSASASGDGIFNWTQRPIEVFFVRYLEIKGLSLFSYGTYDERHIPVRMRRPWTGEGIGQGGWTDRPDHNKFYPDIAVPMELVRTFNINAKQNQSVWVDIYIPKTASPGLYKGDFTVYESGVEVKKIPVQLMVCNATLPDTPASKTMLYYSASNINKRYLGNSSISNSSADGTQAKVLRDRHYLMAHRHKISLIGDDLQDCGSTADQPCPEDVARLTGRLFTSANGYEGPGVNEGNTVYAIGTYGNWGWKTGTQAAMQQHTDAWANWFTANAPNVEYFLYLADESSAVAQMQTWASWIAGNPGPGKVVRSFATVDLPSAARNIPALDIPTSTLSTGVPSEWQALCDRYTSDPRKRFFMYNGHRPANGSFGTDDEGVALRSMAWAQYKKHVNRWFFWESTYYNNYQGGAGETNVFRTAHTFGGGGTQNATLGETGWNYSNGEGVLFYPGTDRVYPADSYGVMGPFASLRLKHWRRGVQDVDYLKMAAAINPGAVQAMVQNMVPKVLWEYGVNDPSDPTWVRSDISWPIDPQKWEISRAQTIAVITGINPLTGQSGAIATPKLGKVNIYPNPWRKDQHNGSPITFANLLPGTQVRIFTVSAHLVTELPASSGSTATWDLKNSAGDPVASGLYLYLAETHDGQTKHGKFAIIR